MGKFLDKFLEFKNEAEGTKKFTLLAVVVLTVGLAILSISGAFAVSEGDWLAWIPRVSYALVVLGLESLAAVLFMRAMLAQDRPRMIVCLVVLPFLVWANVQNAKDGLHFIMPERFGESGETLRERADLAGTRAKSDGETKAAVAKSIPDELARVRREIAKLEDEAGLMVSQTRVREAQERLVVLGLYPADIVDGKREEITLNAMAARGEVITKEIALLKSEEKQLKGETGLPSAAPSPEASPVVASNQDDLVITLNAQAREADMAALRAEVVFWVAEFARNLLLWAAVTSATAAAVSVVRRREDEIAEALHQKALAEIGGATPLAPVSPDPVADLPPAPEAILSDAQRRGRAGGLATAQARAAAKARDGSYILVPSLVARDAAAPAMKVAAE